MFVFFFIIRRPPISPCTATPFPYTALFRSAGDEGIGAVIDVEQHALRSFEQDARAGLANLLQALPHRLCIFEHIVGDFAKVRHQPLAVDRWFAETRDRKSTRLNSSH